MAAAPKLDRNGEQLQRVQRCCSDLPEIAEKISHGMPTFFAAAGPKSRVFATFADNHHGDLRLALWLPVPDGDQSGLIEERPLVFFRPPYVGVKGWVGVLLEQVDDEELALFLQQAWKLTTKKKSLSARSSNSFI